MILNENLFEKAKNLTEGAGAGYKISGELYNIEIEKIVSIKTEEGKSAFGSDANYATIDVIGHALLNGSAESYEYGTELEEEEVTINSISVNVNILDDYNLSNFAQVKLEDLQDEIPSTISFESDYIGSGWFHQKFDGKVKANVPDYPYAIDEIEFTFSNEASIDYIDDAVSGELALEAEKEWEDDDLDESLNESEDKIVMIGYDHEDETEFEVSEAEAKEMIEEMNRFSSKPITTLEELVTFLNDSYEDGMISATYTLKINESCISRIKENETLKESFVHESEVIDDLLADGFEEDDFRFGAWTIKFKTDGAAKRAEGIISSDYIDKRKGKVIYLQNPTSESLKEDINKWKSRWIENESGEIVAVRKNGITIRKGDKIKNDFVTGFEPETDTIYLDENPETDGGRDYSVDDIISFMDPSNEFGEALTEGAHKIVASDLTMNDKLVLASGVKEIKHISKGKNSIVVYYEGEKGEGYRSYKLDDIITVQQNVNKVEEAVDGLTDESNEVIDTSSDEFKYQLLGRLESDCKYYLGAGNREKKFLWAGEPYLHILTMKKLWNSLKEKPEWLTMEQIEEYEKEMTGEIDSLDETLTQNKLESIPSSITFVIYNYNEDLCTRDGKRIPLEDYIGTNNANFYRYDNIIEVTPKNKDTIELVKNDLSDLEADYEIQTVNESLKEELGDIAQTEQEVAPVNQNNGLATVINALIQDEWQAIQGYKDAIVNFEAEGKTELTQILKDILDEENIHVGQLQTLLQEVDNSASKIAEGEVEADEQLTQSIESK